MNLSANQKSPKIVVIGGGVSGLTVAYRLHKKGMDVELYEARNRLGGRVFTVNIGGHLAELGGQNLLDGGEAKHLVALIDEIGLETESKKRIFHFNYYENGKKVCLQELIREKGFTPESLELKLKTIGQTAQNMEEVVQALFGKEDLLYKFCSVLLAGYEGASIEKLSTKYIGTLYHILLGGLSSSHQRSGVEESGYLDYLIVKGGNARLAERLAEKLSHRVHRNYPLIGITKSPQGAYLLTFQNGQKISADLVVLTIPCPVFKDISMSEQVISSKRKQEITSIQYGTTAKILVLAQHINEEQFTNGKIVAFMNRDNHIITMYYIKEHGKFTANSIQEAFLKGFPFMQTMYQVAPSLKPAIALDQSFAFYEEAVGHSWPNDPFAQGSYSCIGAGQEEAFLSTTEVKGETVKTLFAPIENSLFFAGEHTSILFDVGGTMEAAVESGERMARLVEKCSR